MANNSDVDAYIDRSERWPDELRALRPMMAAAGLDESIKWNKPCYSHDDKNICILQEMKDFLAVMFFKGALLEDPAGVLRSQGPNSRSALRLEFTSVGQIDDLADVLADYLREAIDVEVAGLEVPPAPEGEFCSELQARIDADDAFRAGFESLTPGRQREYDLQIAGAKQTQTRLDRIEKFAPKILDGKGFRDR